MKRIIILLSIMGISVLVFSKEAMDSYFIKVKAIPTGKYTVDVEIETDIPGKFVLAVDLTIENQKPEDICIGTQFIKVPVSEGKAMATVDCTKGTLPPDSKLPAGNYDVRATFYHRWKENRVVAKKANIQGKIEGKTTVELTASGSSSENVQIKENGQRWIMENLYSGYPWKIDFWKKKFGKVKQVEFKGEGNKDIIKMYYVESVDMTLMVNAFKKEVITFRIGLANK